MEEMQIVTPFKTFSDQTSQEITEISVTATLPDYPWIHVDMSGVYAKTKYGYRGKGATGMGVRLLYNFIKTRY